MVRKLIVCLLVLACGLPSAIAQQQSKEDIQKRQRALQEELAELNSTLAQIKKNRKQSVGELVLVERKIRTRQALVENISNEIEDLNGDIARNTKSVEVYKKQLDTLRQNYAQSLVFAYKNRNNSDALNFLFSANSFNDAIKRYTYLKSYRRFRESQVANIKLLQTRLQQEINELNRSKVNKNNALGNQTLQLTALESDKVEKDKSIDELRSREGELAKEIAEKNRARIKFRNLMDRIIQREVDEERARQKAAELARQQEIARQKAAAAELARKQELARQKAADEEASRQKAEAEKNNNGNVAAQEPPKPSPREPERAVEKPKETPKAETPAPTRSYSVMESSKETLTQSIDFEKNKGRLPWPVSGYVTSTFGTHSVPGTLLKEYNSGIDIATEVGASVHSVANGVVTYVDEDRGTYSVLINHGKYFTAYGNLSAAHVSRGSKVSAGTPIGSAGAGIDGGGSIYFCVTNENTTYLNPENWLKAGHK